jgi:hypothetical protein
MLPTDNKSWAYHKLAVTAWIPHMWTEKDDCLIRLPIKPLCNFSFFPYAACKITAKIITFLLTKCNIDHFRGANRRVLSLLQHGYRSLHLFDAHDTIRVFEMAGFRL